MKLETVETFEYTDGSIGVYLRMDTGLRVQCDENGIGLATGTTYVTWDGLIESLAEGEATPKAAEA